LRLVAFLQPDQYGLVDCGRSPVIYGLLLTATGPGPGFPIRKAKNRTGPDLKTLHLALLHHPRLIAVVRHYCYLVCLFFLFPFSFSFADVPSTALYMCLPLQHALPLSCHIAPFSHVAFAMCCPCRVTLPFLHHPSLHHPISAWYVTSALSSATCALFSDFSFLFSLFGDCSPSLTGTHPSTCKHASHSDVFTHLG
jgi:hypothetical protein